MPRAGATVPDFDIVQRFGITVYMLADLPEPVLYLPEQSMALVDADLTDEACAEASDWLLSAVASEV